MLASTPSSRRVIDAFRSLEPCGRKRALLDVTMEKTDGGSRNDTIRWRISSLKSQSDGGVAFNFFVSGGMSTTGRGARAVKNNHDHDSGVKVCLRIEIVDDNEICHAGRQQCVSREYPSFLAQK